MRRGRVSNHPAAELEIIRDSDSDDEDSAAPIRQPNPIPAIRKPVILKAASSAKSVDMNVDDFFSFKPKAPVVAGTALASPRIKPLSAVAGQSAHIPKSIVKNTIVASDSDGGEDSAVRERGNHQKPPSPRKRARCEITPPPPEMPQIKIFQTEPKPNLESLELDNIDETDWSVNLEPELRRTLQASKAYRSSDIINGEVTDSRISITLVPPLEYGKTMIIQYNRNSTFENLMNFMCNRFNFNENNMKILYKDVPVIALGTPRALQMQDGEELKILSDDDYARLVQTKREQLRNLLAGKVDEEALAKECGTADFGSAPTESVNGNRDDDDNDEEDNSEADADEDGEWLLLKITNQKQQTTKYKLRLETLVKDLISQYKRQNSLAADVRVELEFDGEPLDANQPISSYDCEDGDQLSARHLH